MVLTSKANNMWLEFSFGMQEGIAVDALLSQKMTAASAAGDLDLKNGRRRRRRAILQNCVCTPSMYIQRLYICYFV